MSIRKTIGGDRLGAGKKMTVDLHGFERSTHDLGYIWRSSMASGTLVPFMSLVALPGDTFDINLNCDVKTHPTKGPLFGSYKVQLDTFIAPVRLYQALLHNNMTKIGMNMSNVKLPTITLTPTDITSTPPADINNSQINQSSLPAYLGIRGISSSNWTTPRAFNAVPILAYWEIYKQYYSNKQEEIGVVLHTPATAGATITFVQVEDLDTAATYTIPVYPTQSNTPLNNYSYFTIAYSAGTFDPSQVIIQLEGGIEYEFGILVPNYADDGAGLVTGKFDFATFSYQNAKSRTARSSTNPNNGKPTLTTFPLDNIDQMKMAILSHNNFTPFEITTPAIAPYIWLAQSNAGIPNLLSSQEGLGIKTYQSDLHNNWMSTDWIDGPTGINAITAIDTSSGKFDIDTLILSRKVFDMLNRIAVSGGTYDDWMDAVYGEERYQRSESPIYCGGLSKELVFQEVVSNSESASGEPLGTLAGKGTMSGKHKGGNVTIKVDEISYIIGIISITPRLDYSQGNNWDINLQSIDDFHKPSLDQIGFQELITEQLAWWDSHYAGTNLITRSAGKQPAWINYQTAINKTYGNFANDSEMWMTLNRRYEPNAVNPGTPHYEIKDLTTYIDPSKFNYIFADTSLDAQNFWTQIAIDITARRKMSAKVMPNL